MKIVKIKGGIGNQLFQYSFAMCLASKGNDVKLDFNYCYKSNSKTQKPRLKDLNISLKEANLNDVKKVCLFPHNSNPTSLKYKFGIAIENLLNRKYFFEKNRKYIEIKEFKKSISYFDGYWQSWRHVFSVENILLNEIKPKLPISKKNLEFIDSISNENSVFVGIRRGDYVKTTKAMNHYGVFSNNYYLNAMNYIAKRCDSPVFYIFSNDIEWCRSNLDFGNYKVVFRENDKQTDDLEELFVMSNCKHAIIVNSTFHWWGAFLNRNPNKIIICPNEWFLDGKEIDICPPEWIRFYRDGSIVN